MEAIKQGIGVNKVYGIKWGFSGFTEDFPENWIELSADKLHEAQNRGGTFLGTSMEEFSLDLVEKAVERLVEMKINHVYVIGGDGSMKGLNEMRELIREAKLKISVIGVPVAIDNDLPYVDRSIGYETCLENAIKAIDSANVEAEAAEFGVGIVRLMGKHCGFIALGSTLASRDVNICLVPELHFQLKGDQGLYEAIMKRAKAKGHVVIVISEGAYNGLIHEDREIVNKAMAGEDLPDLAAFIKKDLGAYATAEHKVKLTIKYLDPMESIRATKAVSTDADMASKLATVAVHSVMAGFTDCVVGIVRNSAVMIPLDIFIEAKNRKIKRKSPEWQRLLQSTGQAHFLSDENFKRMSDFEAKENLKRKQTYMDIKKQSQSYKES
eukprot:CAMPEP_0176362732 /NCGR_PEP_ID=MMETSP0126-20121128/18626_1 /TAXON_ID=141414 ORGANISM="Strombidinopsis acuminatum, Strain SPMC142" /NCGR_SAMPLE_ID=MMETSP0126 /ASSEMBLY_ACC=CAM_ASM_000229 /LENGTH=381 /DNA_ID=CAMNT_0017718751 /DNA_START=597 /DNA_END=1743 /DNA_ORIENTATION=+